MTTRNSRNIILKVAPLKSVRDNALLMRVGTAEEIIYATNYSNDSATNTGTRKRDVEDQVTM